MPTINDLYQVLDAEEQAALSAALKKVNKAEFAMMPEPHWSALLAISDRLQERGAEFLGAQVALLAFCSHWPSDEQTDRIREWAVRLAKDRGATWTRQ